MKTIMIVDDQQQRRQQLQHMISNADFSVISVSSSKQALEQLNTNNGPVVDLILVRTQIPGTQQQGLYSLKPASTMKTAKTDSFLSGPFTDEELEAFLQKEIQE